MPTRYPIYIVSKGRWKNPLTHKALTEMGIPHYMIVEAQEYPWYQDTIGPLATILTLPVSYLETYETCDNIPETEGKAKGPGAARNFALDHATTAGFRRHWVMDDNIDAFHYLTNNEKYEVRSSFTLRAMEDFVDRYTNIVLAGPNYYSFAKKTDNVPAFVKNTRIYSCILMDNHAGFRWRGRYNEDTDLSLRVLKAGFCTVQFNAFLAGKITTQRMQGGNTEAFYAKEGTKAKSEMIAALHPDVAKVVWKFGRWHHTVDYRRFRSLMLQRDPTVVIPTVSPYRIRTIPYNRSSLPVSSPIDLVNH